MYQDNIELVIKEITNALESVSDSDIEWLINEILNADKVFLTGVGRVLLSLQAIAKRLTHLGINAHCVGDITEPAVTEKSLLIVGSGSGCSVVPVVIAKKAKEFNAKVVHIGSNPRGDVASYTDKMIRMPVQTRLYLNDEIKSSQPMTSLFEQSLLILGDIIAMEIIERKKLDLDKLWMWHANLE